MKKQDNTGRPLYILGINFAYHELAACILKDGKLLAAVEEERFSRIKRGKKALIDNPDVLPTQSIAYCCKVAGIKLQDIDYFIKKSSVFQDSSINLLEKI